MKRMHKKLNIFIFFLIFLFSTQINAQSTIKIDYYGIVATEIDENMYKMTSDLYYTQLCEISLFSISDKRDDKTLTTPPTQDSFSNTSLSFYAIIEKEGDSKWISTLYVINKEKQTKKFQTKEYDSYYKILTESKSVLQETLKQLITSNNTSSSQTQKTEDIESLNTVTTEILSGTWDGEDVIDKIVIMRGGRGFVIFKNGASMNIIVKYDDNDSNKISITQNAKSNASFFPDLPRQVALKEAVNASPIEWIFQLKDSDTLIGTKKTLLADGDDKAKEGTVSVTWKRRQ